MPAKAAHGRGPSTRVRVYKENVVLDYALTGAFAAEVVSFLVLMKWTDLQTLGICFCATAIFITMCNSVTRFVGGWVSANLLRSAPYNNPLSRGDNMDKFCAQTWQLVIHVSMTILEEYVHGDRDWMYTNQADVWRPAPWEQTPDVQPHGLRILYMIQLGIWTYTCFSHCFLEPRRKDYFVMYIHHVATIALVGFSYMSNYTRIGLLVLLIHDKSDIAIDLLKMVNFLKLESWAGFFLSELLFFITLGMWAYYRLYTFFVYVIGSTFIISHQELCKRPDIAGRPWADLLSLDFLTTFPFGRDTLSSEIPGYLQFNVLLLVLWCLHVWWFYLLLRIASKFVFAATPPHEIARQEYEGQSESDSDAATKKAK